MNKNIFIVLCGLPGSGKSTLAKKIQKELKRKGKDLKLLSMDSYREKIPNYNRESKEDYKIWFLYNNEINKCIGKGKNILLDSLNLTKKSRTKLIKNVKNNYKKIIIVIDCPIEMAKKNNRNPDRTHIVPDSYYEKIKNSFCNPKIKDGFDLILHVKVNYKTNKIEVISKEKRESL